MSEKEKVLQQISEIKNHLIDRETFFPYNYNACYVWAIIATLLTLGMVPAYEYSTVIGTILLSFFILLGFVVEHNMTRKVNRDYDIEESTKRQAFITQNFLMIALFAILTTTIFAIYQLYAVIMLLWLFLISLGYFSIGFILNIKLFTQMAQLNIAISFLLLTIGIFFDILLGTDSLFFTLTQAVAIFGLAIAPAWVAKQQIDKEKEDIGV
jgi:hypothetical protein